VHQQIFTGLISDGGHWAVTETLIASSPDFRQAAVILFACGELKNREPRFSSAPVNNTFL
jgi:hypothetical protein